MTWIEITLAALATYRLTRLVTADQITARIRVWAERRGAFLGYLTGCDWCLSIWLAPIPTTAVVLWGDNRAILIGLVALSASALTGLISMVEQRLDQS